MSRGWESKSVEEQQSLAGEKKTAGAAQNIAADKADVARSEAEKKRLRQALELQRERVLSERTSSPHRRSALTNALADIEEKLAELGWTVHL
jgi:hypothetical protein